MEQPTWSALDSYYHANLKMSRFFQADEQTLFDNETEYFGSYIHKNPQDIVCSQNLFMKDSRVSDIFPKLGKG